MARLGENVIVARLLLLVIWLSLLLAALEGASVDDGASVTVAVIGATLVLPLDIVTKTVGVVVVVRATVAVTGGRGGLSGSAGGSDGFSDGWAVADAGGGFQHERYDADVARVSVPVYRGHPGTSVFGGARPPPQSKGSQISPVNGSYQCVMPSSHVVKLRIPHSESTGVASTSSARAESAGLIMMLTLTAVTRLTGWGPAGEDAWRPQPETPRTRARSGYIALLHLRAESRILY